MEGSENRIAQVRENKNIRQVDLARRIHMSRGQLANIESGNRKVDLPELRMIAHELACTVADLLLPIDVPDRPEGDEAALLAELRATPGYDARAILIATRAVLQAVQSVRALESAPRSLAGDPALASEMAGRWGNLDDTGRRKALQLLDTAREFSR